MLEVKQLTLHRGAWQRDYDFEVRAGAIVTLQGRSGVGKSALLAAIAGFEVPVSGDICWQGQSLLPLPVQQRPVSLLFQANNLFEHVSVLHNLRLGLDFATRGARDAALMQAAEALEILPYLHSMPTELSGGQRQRVAVLRTLLRPEPLVLLDEPFAELDAHTRALVTDWVRLAANSQHKTVLLVTHQDEDVERIADLNIILTV